MRFFFYGKRNVLPTNNLNVLELNARAEELKKELLKKSGKDTSEKIIEREKAQHKRKRFHTRETWVPL